MIEVILNFIQDNAGWAIVIVFFIAFAESLAIVGLLMPGWLLLMGVGGLIGSDILSFYPTLLGVYLGAVIGEYLSFYLGYHYHEDILNWNFVKKHQKLIDTTHDFFHKHGISSVFFGRFLGPTRAVIPFIAGVAEMDKRQFFWVNLLSGILWAPYYLIPGILVGAAFSLDKDVTEHLAIISVVILIVFFIAIKFSYSYWKIKLEANNHWVLIKAVLAWLIIVVIFIILYKSIYWSLLLDILSLVLNKL